MTITEVLGIGGWGTGVAAAGPAAQVAALLLALLFARWVVQLAREAEQYAQDRRLPGDEDVVAGGAALASRVRWTLIKKA